MPLAGFYYTYGDDHEIIEKKWLPDIEKRCLGAEWLRYDASIDDISVARLVTQYQSNSLFDNGKVILIRNADAKLVKIFELLEELVSHPDPSHTVIVMGSGWNKTTKFGKLIKKHFIVREFSKPEVKPFDMIDSLNAKNSAMVLRHSERLFEADYNPIVMFSLLVGHFLLLKQLLSLRQYTPEQIARKTRQHVFRIKKAMVAFRYWTAEDIEAALHELARINNLLRTWQYDEKILIQMCLIKITS